MKNKSDASDLEGFVERNSNDAGLRKKFALGSIASGIVGIGSILAAKIVGDESPVYLPLMLGASGGLSGAVLMCFGALYHHANYMLQMISTHNPLNNEELADDITQTRFDAHLDYGFIPKNPMRYSRLGVMIPLEIEDRDY